MFARRTLGPILPLGLALVVASCGERTRAAHAAPPAPAPEWLLDGARLEALFTARTTVDRAFRLADARAASGITFVARVVDDAARTYKPAHYDHGTGVAAADVDGDGKPDLYFASQLGTGELWRNLGHGRFENATDRAGLRLPDVVAVAPAFADIDNDGDPDLFLTTVRHGNRLFENVGGGRFRDITAQAGVGYVGHPSGAAFFDYDGDGRLDLFVANVGRYTTDERGRGGFYVAVKGAFHGHTHADRAESGILYHNEGGNRFRDVTRESGLVDLSWSGDATPIDANDDGRPDLYVCDMQGENHLWLNVDGAHFRDATAEYFPRTPFGAMHASALDVNGDGRLDLFVTDMHSDMFAEIAPGEWLAETRKSDPRVIPPDYLPNGTSRLLFGNALFVRGAPGDSVRYAESSRRVGGETYWPWGASVGDLNADGWPDLFVTAGMGFPFRYGVNAVLLNEGGQHLVHSEFTLGVEPRARTALDWYTVDCGGADRGHPSCGVCAQANGDSTVCRGDPRGKITVMGAPSSRGSVILDLDGDGDLDVVTNEFGAAPQVLVSDLAARRRVNYLAVRLRGTRSNREGLGARVTVVLPDGRRLVQPMDGNSGYLGRSDLPLYFGLGAADHAASVEVAWPSGRRQTLGGAVRAGQTVEVTEP